MDIHINKMVAGLMLVSLIVGGLIGGAIGFAASHEEGRGGDQQEMSYKNSGPNQQYDNQADGETADDNGGTPNSDEISNSQVTPHASTTSSINASTTVKNR